MTASLAHQFDRAAAHYNEAAEPQRLVIDRLVQLLEEHLPKTERGEVFRWEDLITLSDDR